MQGFMNRRLKLYNTYLQYALVFSFCDRLYWRCDTCEGEGLRVALGKIWTDGDLQRDLLGFALWPDVPLAYRDW